MILETTAKATLILLAIAASGLLLRRRSAATRHLVQVAGLVAVLALPALIAGAPDWELPVLRSAVAPEAAVSSQVPSTTANLLAKPLAERVDVAEPTAWLLAAVSAPAGKGRADCRCDDEGAATPDATPGPSGVARPSLADPDPDPDRMLMAGIPGGGGFSLGWLTWLWVGGIALVVARLAAGWLYMTRTAIDAAPLDDPRVDNLVRVCCKRLGIVRAPLVMISTKMRVPVLWGIATPTLMLPAAALRWPLGRLRVVLLHELSHLRRGDGLSLLICRLATAIWWFHPLAWVVDRGARRDCERACDDLVIESGVRPSEYAAHLLAVARELPRSATAPAAALAVVGTSQLEGRVRAILHPDRRRGIGRRAVLVAVAVIAFALVPVASVRLVARDSSAPDLVARDNRPTETALAQSAQAPPVTADDVSDRTDGADCPDEGALLAVRRNQDPGQVLLVHEGRNHGGQRLFERAFDLHRRERFEDAAPMFLEAAEAGFRPGTAFYNAACGYAMQGQARKAVELIERAIDEGFDSARLLLGDSDLDPIRDDASFRGLIERVGDDRRSEIGRDIRSHLRKSTGLYADLLEENSTDGRAWYKAGSELLRIRRYAEAEDALERAARNLENNSSALYNLACTYSLQGKLDRALDALNRSVLAGFSSEERFRNDSDLENLRDKPRFAEIRDLAETLSLDRFQTGWNWNGNYSSRRWRPAVEEFTEFTRKHPDVGRAWSNLGWALHFSRSHAAARDAFERQRQLGFRKSTAAYNIACTYAMEDNADAALEWLERSIGEGHVSVGHMIDDDDLENLQDDPRFLDLLERTLEQNRDDRHMDDDSDGIWKQRRKIDWLREKGSRRDARLF